MILTFQNCSIPKRSEYSDRIRTMLWSGNNEMRDNMGKTMTSRTPTFQQ